MVLVLRVVKVFPQDRVQQRLVDLTLLLAFKALYRDGVQQIFAPSVSACSVCGCRLFLRGSTVDTIPGVFRVGGPQFLGRFSSLLRVWVSPKTHMKIESSRSDLCLVWLWKQLHSSVVSRFWVYLLRDCGPRILRSALGPCTFLAFSRDSVGCYRGGQCRPVSGSVRDRAGPFSATQAVLPVGADFKWIPCGALMSRTSSTGGDEWTEGDYVHLSTDAGLAVSFSIPYVLCLTEEAASMVCPAEKVANITGEFGWRVTRVGVQLRLCGQGLRSRSPWLGAEVDGVDFFEALCTGTGLWGHVHRDMTPTLGCIVDATLHRHGGPL